MKIYLARHHNAKTILGVFFAGTLDELFDMVDEVANPQDYQFQELGSGALCFEGDEPSVRPYDEADDTDQDIWSGATELGGLELAMSDMNAGEWKILCSVEKRGQWCWILVDAMETEAD